MAAGFGSVRSSVGSATTWRQKVTRSMAVGEQIASLIWRTYVALVRFGRGTGLANIRMGKSTFGYLVDRSIRRFVAAIIATRRYHGGAVLFGGESSLGAVEMTLGEYEPMTSLILQRGLKPGMVVVDIGAHIGHYTLLSAAAVGRRGQVYSFEPHPANFENLITNIATVGYSNVSAYPYAVADVEGETLLYADPQDSGVHSIYPRTSDAEQFRVRVVALAPFLKGLGVLHVDAVKMDIEGAEPLAVEGMKALIETGRVGVLIVEFAPQNLRRGGREPAEFLRQLKALGLEMYAIDDAVQAIIPLPVRLQENLGNRKVNLLCVSPRGTLDGDWAMIDNGGLLARRGYRSNT